MGFLNESLNKSAEIEAVEKGYVKSTIEVKEMFTNLTNEDWKNFMVEGQIFEIIDSGSHFDAIGVDESGHRYSVGKILRQDTEYRHGVVLFPKIQNKKLFLLQTILLHPDEEPSVNKLGSINLRERSGKSKFEKKIDRMTQQGKDLDNMGKSFMPLTYAAIIIIVLIYMCS